MTSEIRQDAVRQRLPGPRLAVGAIDVGAGVRQSVRQIAAIAIKAAALRARLGSRAAGAGAKPIDVDDDGPWFWRSFIILVVLPVAASFIYFQFIASDQFISEMRFAVRGTTESLPGSDALAASGLGTLASLNTSQDVFIVADYIHSQTIIDDLSKAIDLRAIFSAPGADFIARFNPSGSPEDFLRYWRKAVDPSVEIASGILTVKVKTFSRQDSVRLATAIRARCDIVVNELLDRMRRDMTERGEAEVKAAMDKLAVWRARVEQFRNTRMSIDPLDSAHSLSETIGELRRDLAEVEVKLAIARTSLGADALQIKILQSDRNILSSQISALESRITGAGANGSTASAALADYDRLDVEKKLAEKRVELAEKLLDNARSDANSRHIYLVSIEDPTTPQSSLFPRRGFAILAILIGAFTAWAVIALTVAGVRDHAR
ncbi:hypothetical protein [Methylocella tundrae]|uniref:Capsule polysaccharide export protein-like protein n=1 Tax=Methylocella tundrae TaxID=227605 RepID=A0A4U8YYH0_METTU|nr:hypothetical protein [Methylocella tundrae]WPP05659.1 hypothetical protein SIN04_07555 [Methylocella tundrae]VFU08128.1 Capsule polysaccharide export protein-like protein [Methylocella tundrae]